MVTPDSARPSFVLVIRVLDMDAVQELSVLRRIHWQIGVRLRKIRRCPGETISPTVRKRFYGTHVSVAPWASPVNHEVVR